MAITTLLLIGVGISVIIGDFLFGLPPKAKSVVWGVNFSQKQATNFGLDWKEVYLAVLNDLGAKRLKVATYWDLIEPSEGRFDFQALDWQVQTAESRGAKLILVIGLKTPRWPECHEPQWAQSQKSKVKSQKLLEYLEAVVNRYKDSEAVWAWQVENEPFLRFGECPWPPDEELLKKEVSLVKSLDPSRPVIVSASGEWSFWQKEAEIGDIVGITIYRVALFPKYKIYFYYPFPPSFYWLKSKIIQKDILVVELQAEPWTRKFLHDSSLEEQEKTMNLEKFKANIQFARKTGLKEFYLWGAEWWYWLKEKHNKPEIWNEAKKIFQG